MDELHEWMDDWMMADTPPTNSTNTPKVERLLLALFLVVLAWAPFPYGSNRLWAELVLGLGLGAILVLWAPAVAFGAAQVTSLTRKLLAPALCFGGALAWAAVQTIDLASIDRMLQVSLATSLAHPVWAMAQEALGKQSGAFISVDPALTVEAIVASLLSVASFLLSFELARNGERARILLCAIVVIAAAHAALGLAMFYFDVDLQSWLMPDPRPVSISGRLAGPFINPNHLATFAGLGALCALGLLIEGLTRNVVWDRGRKIMLRTLLQALTGSVAMWFAATAVLLSALLLTQSRGGVVAFLAGAIALVAALALGRGGSGASGAVSRRLIFAPMIVVLAIAAWISGESFFFRIEGTTDVYSGRREIAASSIEAIESAPLLGLGFGAFKRYYPFFGDGSVRGEVDEAHNDYLETLADLGLPAGLAFIAAPLILAFYCAGGCVRRGSGKLFPALGLAATVLVGAHAFVEFGLQVPAIAITYAAILGLGTAQAWSPRGRTETPRR